ncbi:MAG: hypothetical protein KDD64_10640 [Bdellovibrionales bacterium]|nr:hypothetical protein [Bdellovibrionales bacterium]
MASLCKILLAVLWIASLSPWGEVCAQKPGRASNSRPVVEKAASKIKKRQQSVALESARLRFAPMTLPGGSSLTLVTPVEWEALSIIVTSALNDLHGELSELFGGLPNVKTSVRLMEADRFYERTGAPRWTNALYIRNQIIIPIVDPFRLDTENLRRSVRHEYTHAVVSALSGGRCPGWLDEGLAQWAEGEANPALAPALAQWLQYKRPVSLSLLRGGFTKLDSDMVPAAYAQSLFATKVVMKNQGFEKLGAYLRELKTQNDVNQAFVDSFKLSIPEFEVQLGRELKDWSKQDGFRRAHILEQ